MRRLTFPDQQQTQQTLYKINVTGALKERGTDGDRATCVDELRSHAR